jgi:subtilisin family serine protease
VNELREFFESLVYHTVDRQRFTQQSPVMPDVWISYGLEPGKKQELLMVPHWHHTAGDLALALKGRLAADRDGARLAAFRQPDDRPAAIAYNQNAVVATLWFDQLLRAVLPLSEWWRDRIARIGDRKGRTAPQRQDRAHLRRKLAAGLREGAPPDVPGDLIWLTRVAGLLTYLSTESGRLEWHQHPVEAEKVVWLRGLLRPERSETLARTMTAVLDRIAPLAPEPPVPLYTVNRNRASVSALVDSVPAVKADAARRVFGVTGKGVRWAVVDSGIDARHIAFRQRDADGRAAAGPFGAVANGGRRRLPRAANRTRILATYDFVHIRELLGAEDHEVDRLDRDRFPALRDRALRDLLRRILGDAAGAANEGRPPHTVDWERLEPLLQVPHTDETAPNGYRPPGNRHGTHVAGILAGEWKAEDDPPSPAERDLTGMCPALELYDLRVLDERGEGNEFAIMSALQFVRYLNTRRDFQAVHGVNLSFSLDHDVANYACGRTPVCEEAERLVGTGVIVVAAAGNSGRARYLTPSGVTDDGFRTVSITDPGNARSVITVGSTHRRDAHTYGVSYFSSRGPTGDGRLKPDLVAPGEKIRGPVTGNGDDTLDGTSMAAPHVSGAAALIIARHPEFIGQPARIKEILCATATDLGRERYFQGAGVLDVLRALQSI